jgi:hypothetical protein
MSSDASSGESTEAGGIVDVKSAESFNEAIAENH